MAELKTDYKDQLLDSSANTKRVYNLVDSDGNVVAENVSLEDVTVYSQNGDIFGAMDINKTNERINSLGGFTPIIDETTGEITGYKTEVGADTVFPFNSTKLIGEFSGTMPTVNTYDGKQHDATSNSTITVDNLPSENPDDYIVNITRIQTGGGGGNGIASGTYLNAGGNYYPTLSINANTITIQNTGLTRMIGTQAGREVTYKYALIGKVYYIG